MIDAAVRASADTVTVVIPILATEDKIEKISLVPISSRVIVDILTAMGTDKLLL